MTVKESCLLVVCGRGASTLTLCKTHIGRISPPNVNGVLMDLCAGP